MKRVKDIYKAVMVILILLTGPIVAYPVYAQGGCPADPIQARGVRQTVIEALPLTPYIPEAPSTHLNQNFYTTALEFSYDPMIARVFLAGSPDGRGQLCADDLIRLHSQDWEFRLDFRSSDRYGIVAAEPIDISYMFAAGPNQLKVELVDLAPDFYSASPLWLVIVDAPAPLVVVAATATPTPKPPPTTTPKLTASPSPSPTPTPQPARLSITPPDRPEEMVTPRWPMWQIGSLLGPVLIALILLSLVWRRWRPVLPVGEVKVYRDSAYVATHPLAEFGKPVVTLGRAGDIGLDDDTLADYVAQFRAQRLKDGEVETMLEHLDPDNPRSLVGYEPLQHGDQLQFGPFTLHYAHYTEEATLIVKGDYSHV